MLPSAQKIDFSYEKYGFRDEEHNSFKSDKGLSEKTVREISSMKEEPAWMLEYRLKALKHFFSRPMPAWGADLSGLNFDEIYYYVKPNSPKVNSWDMVPEQYKQTFDKLGIPEAEKKFLSGAGAQYDSENVIHTLNKELAEKGVVFSDVETALKEQPELVKEYFGKIIPCNDNKFSALNSAVWSGGSFVYIPKGVNVSLPLQAYFRINASKVGQFERTLIIAEEGSSIHYLEGCSAPIYSAASLHSAVVEIVAKKNSKVQYTTIQNWSNNVYNLVTKRAYAYENASVFWLDGNLGSARTMKYPSVYLLGENARAEILSLAYAGKGQQQDSGGKAVHCAPNTTSIITSKSVCKDGGRTSYRGLLKVAKGCTGVKSSVRCLKPETILLGDNKPIIEYRVGENVIGQSGLNEVKETFVNDFDGEMVEIRADGLLPFEVTPEHPLLIALSKRTYPCVIRNGKHTHTELIDVEPPKWENAENLIAKKSLTKGHYLVIPRLKGDNGARELGLSEFIKQNNSPKIIRRSLPLDERTAWLMGIYVAEGFGDGSHLRFALGSQEPLKEKIREIFSELGYNSSVHSIRRERAVEVVAFSNVLARAFKEWFGHRATGKKIPDFILLHKDLNIVKSFLEGYLAGDGCLSKNCLGARNLVHAVTVSKLLAMQLQLLGARLGMFFRITINRGAGKSTILGRLVSVHEKYDVRCNISDKIKARIRPYAIFVPIRSVTRKLYAGKVYNVETTDHTYLISNVITHNCDALILDELSRSDTYPYMEIEEEQVSVGHEASVGKIGEEQLFYLMSRGLTESEALALIVLGFIEEFQKRLPMEYALEINRLIEMDMAGSVG